MRSQIPRNYLTRSEIFSLNISKEKDRLSITWKRSPTRPWFDSLSIKGRFYLLQKSQMILLFGDRILNGQTICGGTSMKCANPLISTLFLASFVQSKERRDSAT